MNSGLAQQSGHCMYTRKHFNAGITVTSLSQFKSLQYHLEQNSMATATSKLQIRMCNLTGRSPGSCETLYLKTIQSQDSDRLVVAVDKP